MKTLRCVNLREWEERLLDVELTTADRSLLRQFSKRGANGIRIEELRDSVRIQTSSSIGVIRLDSIEIRVEPKLAGDNVRVVEMLELATGLDLLRRYRKSHELHADGKDLFELIVLLLVTEVERLIRSGLLSSYRQEEDLLPVIRGRLLGDRQMLLRFGILDKLHCRFDDLSQNVLENQILTSALRSCESFIVNDVLRHRVRSCLADLLSCCDATNVDRQQAKQLLVYDRLNQHYRPAHELCWLILEQTGIRDFQTQGKAKCFSFLLNMNQLFEQFVTILVRKLTEPHGFRVKVQQKDASIICDALTNKSYSKVVPDLKIYPPDQDSFCIDAKYKLYDEQKISSSDIYQAFLYAFAYGKQPSNRHAVLIFPCTKQDFQIQQLRIDCANGNNAQIRALGVHIPTVLDELNCKSEHQTCLLISDALTNARL